MYKTLCSVTVSVKSSKQCDSFLYLISSNKHPISPILQFTVCQITGYLSKASKAYTPLRVKIPVETENKLSGDKLNARIAELTA